MIKRYLVRAGFSKDLFGADVAKMTCYRVARHQAVHGPGITLGKKTINKSYSLYAQMTNLKRIKAIKLKR